MKTEAELTEICDQLRHGVLAEDPIILSIEEFSRLYEISIIRNDRQIPSIVLVNLGDQAHLLFPEWSRQEIIVESRTQIGREDFAFLSVVDWRGSDTRAPNFAEFLVQEIWHNKLRTGILYFTAFSTLLAIGPSLDTLDLVNTLLIQASTVFLSIYLIFIVSQSGRLSSDKKLFDSGILHKYYSDDRNVTRFAILTIAVVFGNTVLVHAPILGRTLQNPLADAPGRWVAAFSTAIAMTMLFHTFFIVADYYLGRTRDLAEREHVGHTFHEEYCLSASNRTRVVWESCLPTEVRCIEHRQVCSISAETVVVGEAIKAALSTKGSTPS